jgi:hypothetical protein
VRFHRSPLSRNIEPRSRDVDGLAATATDTAAAMGPRGPLEVKKTNIDVKKNGTGCRWDPKKFARQKMGPS